MRSASRSGVADTEAAPERAGVAPAAMGLGVGASRRAGVIPEKSEPASETFSPPSSGVWPLDKTARCAASRKIASWPPALGVRAGVAARPAPGSALARA